MLLAVILPSWTILSSWPLSCLPPPLSLAGLPGAVRSSREWQPCSTHARASPAWHPVRGAISLQQPSLAAPSLLRLSASAHLHGHEGNQEIPVSVPLGRIRVRRKNPRLSSSRGAPAISFASTSVVKAI